MPAYRNRGRRARANAHPFIPSTQRNPTYHGHLAAYFRSLGCSQEFKLVLDIYDGVKEHAEGHNVPLGPRSKTYLPIALNTLKFHELAETEMTVGTESGPSEARVRVTEAFRDLVRDADTELAHFGQGYTGRERYNATCDYLRFKISPTRYKRPTFQQWSDRDEERKAAHARLEREFADYKRTHPGTEPNYQNTQPSASIPEATFTDFTRLDPPESSVPGSSSAPDVGQPQPAPATPKRGLQPSSSLNNPAAYPSPQTSPRRTATQSASPGTPSQGSRISTPAPDDTSQDGDVDMDDIATQPGTPQPLGDEFHAAPKSPGASTPNQPITPPASPCAQCPINIAQLHQLEAENRNLKETQSEILKLAKEFVPVLGFKVARDFYKLLRSKFLDIPFFNDALAEYWQGLDGEGR